MSTNTFLSTLEEFLENKNDAKAHLESRKRLTIALNEYIDFRIAAVLEERRRIQDFQRLALLDNETNWADIFKLIEALNSAPPPPTDTTNFATWCSSYHDWYHNVRKNIKR